MLAYLRSDAATAIGYGLICAAAALAYISSLVEPLP